MSALLASMLSAPPAGGAVPDSLLPPEKWAVSSYPWDRTGKWMMIGGATATVAAAPFWFMVDWIDNVHADLEDRNKCQNQHDTVACDAAPHQPSEGPKYLAIAGAAVFATGLLIRIFSPDDPAPSARLEWEPRRGGMAAKASLRF